jgi:hypothetical protein
MESEWSGLNIQSGRPIRQTLAQENKAYVNKMAPSKYWDALIPKTEIGCKRKVLYTEHLKSLWNDDVELVSDDPVETITEHGVLTRSGREFTADAVVLAIGFATQQMLCPTDIIGREGLSLSEYVSSMSFGTPHQSKSAPFGVCMLIHAAVGHEESGCSTSLLRHSYSRHPKFIRPHGPKHRHWSPICHLHRRMPDQLYPLASSTRFSSPSPPTTRKPTFRAPSSPRRRPSPSKSSPKPHSQTRSGHSAKLGNMSGHQAARTGRWTRRRG